MKNLNRKQRAWRLGAGAFGLLVGSNFALAAGTTSQEKQEPTLDQRAEGVMEGITEKVQGLDQGEKVLTEVKIRDLNKNPGRFAGAQVVVSGEVDHIESPRAFILEGSGLFNDKILVVVESPETPPTKQKAGTSGLVIKEDEKLQLVGRVEQMGIAKIEKKYSPLKAEIKAEIEDNIPVLIVSPSGIKKVS